MQNPTGSFIVIEGSDGSGKTTQFKLLAERLKAVGYEIEVFKFPQYDNDSSFFVKKYLNGDYGPASSISPYTATLFYALDRFEASARIKKALTEGKIVICDRYVGSNMAHQGGKFTDPVEQRGFFVWEDSLEYQLLGLPRPTVNIFLKVPAEMSVSLAANDKNRQSRNYTTKPSDEHEKDIEHLKKSVDTFDLLCQLFPSDFKAIECVRNEKLLSIPDINDLIWNVVKPILPPAPVSSGHGVTVNLKEDLSTVKKSPLNQPVSESQKLSIAKPLSLKLIFDIGSEILPFESQNYSWASTNYSYLTPQLPKKTKQKYLLLLKRIVSARQKLDLNLKKEGLSKKLAYPATPLCALANVKLELDVDQATALVKKLSGLDSSEAKLLQNDILSLAKKTWPAKLTSGLSMAQSSKPEKIDSILNRLANQHIPQLLSEDKDSVSLIEARPKNEFNLLADFVYPNTELPRPAVENEIGNLNYQDKVNGLTALLSSNKRISTDQLLYKFDVTLDRITLGSFVLSGSDYSIKMQPPTPRFGYDVPEELDKHSLVDDYLSCFDDSLELFSMLQSLSSDSLNAYGVMLGHKSRFQLTCSVEYLKELNKTLTSSNPVLYKAIVNEVAAAHPIIGSCIQPEKK